MSRADGDPREELVLRLKALNKNEKIALISNDWFTIGDNTIKDNVLESVQYFAQTVRMQEFTPYELPIPWELFKSTPGFNIPETNNGEAPVPNAKKRRITADSRRTFTRRDLTNTPKNEYTGYDTPTRKRLGLHLTGDGGAGVSEEQMAMNYYYQTLGNKEDYLDRWKYLTSNVIGQAWSQFDKHTSGQATKGAEAFANITNTVGGAASLAGGVVPGAAEAGQAFQAFGGLVTGLAGAIEDANARKAFIALSHLYAQIKWFEEQLGIGKVGGGTNYAQKAVLKAIKEYNKALESADFREVKSFIVVSKDSATASSGADRNLISFETETGATVDCTVDIGNIGEDSEGRDVRNINPNITVPTPVVKVDGGKGNTSGGVTKEDLAGILDANNRQLNEALKGINTGDGSRDVVVRDSGNNKKNASTQQDSQKNSQQAPSLSGPDALGSQKAQQAGLGVGGGSVQALTPVGKKVAGPSVETGGAVVQENIFQKLIHKVSGFFG